MNQVVEVYKDIPIYRREYKGKTLYKSKYTGTWQGNIDRVREDTVEALTWGLVVDVGVICLLSYKAPHERNLIAPYTLTIL